MFLIKLSKQNSWSWSYCTGSLKEATYQISKPLAIQFNKSLNSGKVPDIWKLANVTPIQKKEDKTLPVNYSLISLTSVVVKLMGTMISDKLVYFTRKNIKIDITQHDFHNKHSCLTNLLEFYNNVFNNHYEAKAIDIIYLDFQNPFDKVPHEWFLEKFIKKKKLSWCMTHVLNPDCLSVNTSLSK